MTAYSTPDAVAGTFANFTVQPGLVLGRLWNNGALELTEGLATAVPAIPERNFYYRVGTLRGLPEHYLTEGISGLRVASGSTLDLLDQDVARLDAGKLAILVDKWAHELATALYARTCQQPTPTTRRKKA